MVSLYNSVEAILKILLIAVEQFLSIKTFCAFFLISSLFFVQYTYYIHYEKTSNCRLKSYLLP